MLVLVLVLVLLLQHRRRWQGRRQRLRCRALAHHSIGGRGGVDGPSTPPAAAGGGEENKKNPVGCILLAHRCGRDLLRRVDHGLECRIDDQVPFRIHKAQADAALPMWSRQKKRSLEDTGHLRQQRLLSRACPPAPCATSASAAVEKGDIVISVRPNQGVPACPSVPSGA